MSVSSAAVSVLLNLKLLTLNVNIDNLIKTQKSHTDVSNYQNGILPLLIRMYRVPVLKFHHNFHTRLERGDQENELLR